MNKHIMSLSAAIALLAACNPDADGDGFKANEDCDDLNADANPSATEIRGNDVDEDCSGTADPFRYVGDWTLSSSNATDPTDGSYDFFEYFRTDGGTITGMISIASNLAVEHTLTLTDDEDYDQTFDLTGTAEPAAAEDDFTLSATGEFTYDYDGGVDVYHAEATMSCTATESEMTCTGNHDQDGYSLDTTLVFTK